MNTPLTLTAAAALFATTLTLAGCNAAPKDDTAPAKPVATRKPVDPNAPLCPVDGVPLGSTGDPVYADYDGRKIGFASPEAAKKFNADPAAYLHNVK